MLRERLKIFKFLTQEEDFNSINDNSEKPDKTEQIFCSKMYFPNDLMGIRANTIIQKFNFYRNFSFLLKIYFDDDLIYSHLRITFLNGNSREDFFNFLKEYQKAQPNILLLQIKADSDMEFHKFSESENLDKYKDINQTLVLDFDNLIKLKEFYNKIYYNSSFGCFDDESENLKQSYKINLFGNCLKIDKFIYNLDEFYKKFYINILIINEDSFDYQLPYKAEDFNSSTQNKINQFLKFLEEKIDFHILYNYKTIFLIKILNHSSKNFIRNSILEYLGKNNILYSFDSLFLNQILNIKFLKVVKIKEVNSSNFKIENLNFLNDTKKKEKNISKKIYLTEKKKNSLSYLDDFSLITIANDFKNLKNCNYDPLKEKNLINKIWNTSKNPDIKKNKLFSLKIENKFAFREILNKGGKKHDDKQKNSSSKKNKFCKIFESNKENLTVENLVYNSNKDNKNLVDLELDYDVDNLVDKVLNSFECEIDLDENLCKTKKLKKNVYNFQTSFLSKIKSEEKENHNILSNLNEKSTLLHPIENKTNILFKNFNQLKNNELDENLQSNNKQYQSSINYNSKPIDNKEKSKNNLENNKEILLESININGKSFDSKENTLNFTNINTKHSNSNNSAIDNNIKNNKPYSKSILNFMANLNKNYNTYIIQKNQTKQETNNIKFLQNGIYYKYLSNKSSFASNILPYIYTKTNNAQSNILHPFNKEYTENDLIRNSYVNSNINPREKLNYKDIEAFNYHHLSNDKNVLNSYQNIYSNHKFNIPMHKINSRAIIDNINNDKDFNCNFSFNNELNNNALKNYLSFIASSGYNNKLLRIEDSIKNESLENNFDLENENEIIKNDINNSKKIKNSILSNELLKSHEFNSISNRQKENNHSAFLNIHKNIIDSANESYLTELSLNPHIKNSKDLNLFVKNQKKFLQKLKLNKISFIDINNKEKEIIPSILNSHIPENKELLNNQEKHKHNEKNSFEEENFISVNESLNTITSNSIYNISKINSSIICNSGKSLKSECIEKKSQIIEPIKNEDKKRETILETKKLKLKDILKLDKLKSEKIPKINSISINSELNKIDNNVSKNIISMPPPKLAKVKEQTKSSKSFPIITENYPKNFMDKSYNNLTINQKSNELEKKILNPYNIVYFENYSGIIKRNTPDEERKKYIINQENILQGFDKRTTLMIKNIPIHVTQINLVERINKNFNDYYNFFYLPIDFIKKSNVGYAFINFRDPQTIVNFCKMYEGKSWGFDNDSRKICYISYARIQGYRNICDHFKKSSIMKQVDDQIKPIMLD